jgi:hypothetical protein
MFVHALSVARSASQRGGGHVELCNAAWPRIVELLILPFSGRRKWNGFTAMNAKDSTIVPLCFGYHYYFESEGSGLTRRGFYRCVERVYSDSGAITSEPWWLSTEKIEVGANVLGSCSKILGVAEKWFPDRVEPSCTFFKELGVIFFFGSTPQKVAEYDFWC